MIRRFLDIEAREDDDVVDSEEEEELNEQFLDDGLESGHPPPTPPTTIALPDNRETILDELIEKILTTARAGNTAPTYDGKYGDNDLALGNIARMPREGDYPLWQVKCRVGTEEIAVLSLLGTAKPHHQLRSAFTRGSIRGSIYLECTMNTALIYLLRITPGVIRSNQGIHRNMIDPTEQVDLLTMRSQKVEVEEGDWVLVKKGLYSGDVGIVSTVYSWGVRVLLVPRLDMASFSSHTGSQSRKRKASAIKPAPKLFDPEEFSLPSTVPVTTLGERSFSIGLLQFEDGLVAKDFDFHSFSNVIAGIPLNHHLLFAQSRHPRVVLSCMPRPLEWVFKESDEVLLSSGGFGVIRTIGVYSAEVERSDPTQSVMEWVEQVPWHSIRKDVKVGQYAHAHAGPHAGMAGWVITINGEFATLATKVLEGEVLNHGNELNFLDVLINCLEVTEPPFILHTQKVVDPNGSVPTSEVPNSLTQRVLRHPWCGTNVKISRRFHSRKGETGIIKEVIGHLDGTDIKLVIQLTRYNPSAPFQIITVNYSDVVELGSLKELVFFLDPGPRFCRPRPQPLKNAANASKPHSEGIPVVCDPGGQTPLPSSPDTSGSIAWDPSSRIPEPWDHLLPPSPYRATSECRGRALSPLPSSSASPSPLLSGSHPIVSPLVNSAAPFPAKKHVLLDPRLVGASMNVIVDGGGYTQKELVASILLDSNGVPTLRYVKYRTSTLLKPEWVTPKHPNPTHDNGLLIVIQGDNCGKYVRRIHHQRENGAIRTIIVAVVSRSDGQPDQLTGEQLELEVDFFCTVTESKKQKDMNWNLMQEAREQYRHSHR